MVYDLELPNFLNLVAMTTGRMLGIYRPHPPPAIGGASGAPVEKKDLVTVIELFFYEMLIIFLCLVVQITEKGSKPVVNI